MTEAEIKRSVQDCLEKGNWIIRADNDGISPSLDANGFKWSPIGEWTEAPDWNEHAGSVCGLHGQDMNYGGFTVPGSRLVFCETEGPHVPLGTFVRSRVKVRKARILLVNRLPEHLRLNGSLAIVNCPQLTVLCRKSLHVGGYFHLTYCSRLTTLPDSLHVGGSLLLWRSTNLKQLPKDLHVGETLDLTDCSRLTSLPEGLKIRHGSLILKGCKKLTTLPRSLRVLYYIYLNGTQVEKVPEELQEYMESLDPFNRQGDRIIR